MFRDIGILRDDLQPAAETPVRCYFPPLQVFGQYVASGIATAIGISLALVHAKFLPSPLNYLGASACLAGFGVGIYLATHCDYRWVELDGNTLRAKHLYFGRAIERTVDEIQCLTAIVHQMRSGTVEVAESIFGRLKGIEIRFRDGATPLRIIRYDPAMANAFEFINALMAHMALHRDIEAEIIDFAGAPLVRGIHWKGESIPPSVSKSLKVSLVSVLLIAIAFATILGLMGQQEFAWRREALRPAHELSLKTFVTNGPGDNPHVILTDFELGGSYTDERNFWIALFPARIRESVSATRSNVGRDIQAVLWFDRVPSRQELDQLKSANRVNGISSHEASSSFGAKLGPELIKANGGGSLRAWEIHEMSAPPSERTIQFAFWGSGACDAVVLLVAVLLSLKR